MWDRKRQSGRARIMHVSHVVRFWDGMGMGWGKECLVFERVSDLWGGFGWLGLTYVDTHVRLVDACMLAFSCTELFGVPFVCFLVLQERMRWHLCDCRVEGKSEGGAEITIREG
jgi:hypothetical protein